MVLFEKVSVIFLEENVQFINSEIRKFATLLGLWPKKCIILVVLILSRGDDSIGEIQVTLNEIDAFFSPIKPKFDDLLSFNMNNFF